MQGIQILVPIVTMVCLSSGCFGNTPHANGTANGGRFAGPARVLDLSSWTAQATGLAFAQAPAAGDDVGSNARLLWQGNSTEQGAVFAIRDHHSDYPGLQRLLVAGAFVHGNQVVAQANDSWFFARVLVPGTKQLVYGDLNQVLSGAVMVALNESSFAGLLRLNAAQFLVGDAAGVDARNLLVVVAYHKPSGASGIALAISWWDEQRSGNLIDFSGAIAHLAKTRQALRPVIRAETASVDLAYYSQNPTWNFVRFPAGTWNVALAQGLPVNGPDGGPSQTTYSYHLHGTPGAWLESFYYSFYLAAGGRWCYQLGSSTSPPSRCWQDAVTPATQQNRPAYFAVRPRGLPNMAGITTQFEAMAVGPPSTVAYAFAIGIDMEKIAGLPAIDNTNEPPMFPS